LLNVDICILLYTLEERVKDLDAKLDKESKYIKALMERVPSFMRKEEEE
jgi:hypothetical protein